VHRWEFATFYSSSQILHFFFVLGYFSIDQCNLIALLYLQQGETGANVLVGIQVPSSEIDEFHDRANGLGYDYNVVVKTVATQRLIY
jgi:hypothetical protein